MTAKKFQPLDTAKVGRTIEQINELLKAVGDQVPITHEGPLSDEEAELVKKRYEEEGYTVSIATKINYPAKVIQLSR